MTGTDAAQNKKIWSDRRIVSPLTGGALLRVFRSSVSPELGIFSRHHHTAFEITMVIEGSGVYSTKNGAFRFGSGDIFYFSTDEFHWITELKCETNFLNVHFEPRFIWSENFGISNIDLMRIFFSRSRSLPPKLSADEGGTQVIRGLLHKIEKEFTDCLPEYETMVKIELLAALIEMTRLCGNYLSDETISGSSQTLHYIDKAINYIDNNLENELTLEVLSDVAHMSKTYFSCQFRKLNGISPWEYITIKRIERAIEYIETTSMTRLEIALKCGFNNTSNFYHAFKRVTGKTPGDYKKQAAGG